MVLLLAAVLLPQFTRARINQTQIKAGTQIRGFGQSLINWAADHKGSMPLPSVLDRTDATVAATGRAKDTSANIVSMLIFEQMLVPELMVSPLETNPNVEVMTDYSYSAPASAVRPDEALWDPAFSADFTASTPGHLSFAHMPPVGTSRFAKWSTSAFTAGTVLVGTRGPEMVGVGGTAREPLPIYANPKSNMLLDGPWQGTVAFGDGHAEFLTSPFVRGVATINGVAQPADALFVDETWDTHGENDFLGIFTTAGAMPADFRAIWD